MLWRQGKSILDMTFKVATGVTSYLASASRAGLCPFRFVILDSSDTTAGPGEAYRPPIKYPNTSFANGEKLIGVAVRNQDTNSAARDYDPAPHFYPNPVGGAVDVRLAGTAPVFTDSTVASTNILVGDYVKSSVTSNYDGCGCKAALTNNAPSANAHVGGIAWNKAAAADRIVIVQLGMREV